MINRTRGVVFGAQAFVVIMQPVSPPPRHPQPAPSTPPKCMHLRWCRVCCRFTLNDVLHIHAPEHQQRLRRLHAFTRTSSYRSRGGAARYPLRAAHPDRAYRLSDAHPYRAYRSSLREHIRHTTARRIYMGDRFTPAERLPILSPSTDSDSDLYLRGRFGTNGGYSYPTADGLVDDISSGSDQDP